jgi:hypothetical protein
MRGVTTIVENWDGKEQKKSVYFMALSQHSACGTEEKKRNPSQDNCHFWLH